MDIQSLKIELAQKILRSTKPELLEEVNRLFRDENGEDWWNELPPEIKNSITLGLKESENDHVFEHEQVVRETREKYGF